MRLPWQPDWNRINAELAAVEPPAPPRGADVKRADGTNLNDALMALPAPTTQSSPFGMQRVGWQEPPRRGSAEMLAALYSSPPLMSVVGLITKMAAKVSYYTGTLEEPSYTHRGVQLLRNFNPQLKGVAGRKLAFTYKITNGELIAPMLPSEQPGKDWDIYPVPPSSVIIDSGRRGRVYRVRLGGQEYTFPATQVLHWREPNPLNPYGRGMGPGWVLGDEVEAYEYASKHVKAYFYNSASPEMIFSVKGASPEVLAKAKQDFSDKHRGFRKHWQPVWLNAEVDVKELTRRLGQDRVEELRTHWVDIFRFVYHVPPELLGDQRYSKWATIKESLQLFGVIVTDPLCAEFGEFWQLEVMDARYDGELLHYESPIPKVFDRRDEIMSRHPYAFLRNEIRQEAGFAPREDGNTYPVPSNIVMAQSERMLRDARTHEPILRLVEPAAAE